jgi:integrase
LASYKIYLQDNGKHKAVVRFNDRTQTTKTDTSKSKVKAWAEEEISKAKQGLNPDGHKVPFKAWRTQWWDVWSTHPKRSPNAVEAYESRIRLHIAPFFDKLRLGQITPMTIQTWQNKLPLGRASIMGCRTALYSILEAARLEKHIPDNPMKGVPAPAEEIDEAEIFGELPRVWFEPEELGRLLAAAGPYWADMFVTHVATGMRPQEIVGLQVSRVHLLKREIRIREVGVDTTEFKGLKDRPKSVSSVRPIPLALSAVAAIARHIPANADPGTLVFPGPGGGRGQAKGKGRGRAKGDGQRLSTDTYRHALNRAVERAGGFPGLEIEGTKTFRHTFSTWLEDAGIPTRVIAELMGHRPSGPIGRSSRAQGADRNAVTARYTHTTPAMIDRVLTALEERLAVAFTVATNTPNLGPRPGRRADLEQASG